MKSNSSSIQITILNTHNIGTIQTILRSSSWIINPWIKAEAPNVKETIDRTDLQSVREVHTTENQQMGINAD